MTSDYRVSSRVAELDIGEKCTIPNVRGSGKKLIIRSSQRIGEGEIVLDIYYEGKAPPIPEAVNPCGNGKAHFLV